MIYFPMKKDIPELSTQDVGGAELSYLYYPGSQSQMLFAHATGFLPWLWHPVFEKLDREASIWAPYICNYRSCNPYEGGLSWDIVAADIATLCRAQKIENPVLVGHSMGATVVTIAAAAYGVKPRAMVLIEPIFLPDEYYSMPMSVKDHPLASKSIRRLNRWQSEEEAMSYLKSRSFFADWDPGVMELYVKYGMEKQNTGDLNLTCTPENEAAMFMGGSKRSPWPLLEKIDAPTLVVEGGQSPNIGLVDIARAVSLLPRGQYRRMDGAGHLIPMQRPVETAAMIREFLTGLD